MRRWKTCLLPILTCLTAAVLALLPPKLSMWEDGRRIGTVQCEVLPENSNFPSAPPDLAGRIRLLAQWEQAPENITIVQQLIEEPDMHNQSAAMLHAAVDGLAEAGVIPSGHPVFNRHFTAVRLYLRNQEDLSSAGFLNIGASDEAIDFRVSMTLDLETGKALSFRYYGPAVFLENCPAETIGARFLAYLQDGEPEEFIWTPSPEQPEKQNTSNPEEHAGFFLPDCQCRYDAVVSPHLMKFTLELM